MVVAGCRGALVPNVNTNQPPETWITAAPQDTLTTKDPQGRVIPPVPGTIPVKFHLYWAGSDPDGDVRGFFFAVVETLPVPLPGATQPPRLPGPKPQDYRFTTKTDSTFIFTVSEFSPDRQHAFFIYAVDDKGAGDPTPARFIFNARDRFPPIPIIEEASATGRVFRQRPDGTLFTKDTTYFVTDTLNPQTVTTQFVPVNSRLLFRWRAELTSPELIPARFRYKLDEPDFVTVDSSVKRVEYPAGRTGPGQKIFTLRAVDQAGGARQTTRRFGVNIPPDTWWSGPNPNWAGWSTRPKWPGTTQQQRYVAVSSWNALPGIVGSLMSCDSTGVLPAARPFHRTFLEFYRDTIYLRAESDTVNLNSWVILSNGGFDEDSPYNVRISPIDPGLPDTSACAGLPVVIRPGPANGSPVGFRAFIGTYLDPVGPFSSPSVTGLYPLFDPVDFRRQPTINSYWKMIQSGKAYATVRSEDGTGLNLGGLDTDVPGNLRDWTDNLDGGGGSPEERRWRNSKVMTFEVNYPAFLLTNAPTFSPKLRPGGAPDTLATRQVNMNFLADDRDPLDPNVLNPPVGGPTASKVFRYTVSFRGTNAAGRDTVISPSDLFRLNAVNVPSYPIPADIVSQRVDLLVELCDCRECEIAAGRGKCTTTTFPLFAPPPPASLSSSAAASRNGPGSQALSRSTRP